MIAIVTPAADRDPASMADVDVSTKSSESRFRPEATEGDRTLGANAADPKSPRPRSRVTDTWLKARLKKARRETSVVTDRDGLGIRISPKGKLTFQFRYSYGGAPDRVDIGSYPFMSLVEARAEVLRLGRALEQGENPKILLRTEQATIVAANAETFEKLFRVWYQKFASKAKKSAPQILRSFELYVFPTLGDLPVLKMTLHTWLPLLETLAEDIPGTAERVLVNAKQFFKWCRKRRYIETSPIADVMAAEDLQIRKAREVRNLSDVELKCVFRAVERSRMALKNRVFLLICLIYGCRNGELRLSKLAHLDFVESVWTVPAENHKVGQITKRPLLRPIISVTEFLFRLAMQLADNSEWLFPNEEGTGPMTHSFCAHFPYNIMQYIRRYENVELEHWSMHDLRKTARSRLSKHTQWHVAEIALGHILPGEWKVYDGHDYLVEMREAYSAYWPELASLIRASRLEVAPTRRRFDARQHLNLPDIDAPFVARKIDRFILPRSSSCG